MLVVVVEVQIKEQVQQQLEEMEELVEVVLGQIQVHDQLLVVLVEEVLGLEFQTQVLVTLQVHHQVKETMEVMVVDNPMYVFMVVLVEVLVLLVVRQVSYPA